MKPRKVIVQTLLKKVNDEYEEAQMYYSLLSTINNLKLTQKEIQLTAFTAIRGNISYSSIINDFCQEYKTTAPTIYNMVSKLKKMRVMVKDGTKIKVNPAIILNFNNHLKLEIKLEHNESETKGDADKNNSNENADSRESGGGSGDASV